MMTEAVHQLIENDVVLYNLWEKVSDGQVQNDLISDLVHRLAYLRPNDNRLRLKYLQIWIEDRQSVLRFRMRDTDLPLTSHDAKTRVVVAGSTTIKRAFTCRGTRMR